MRSQSKFFIVLCVMLVMPVLLWWDLQSGAIKFEDPDVLNNRLIQSESTSGATCGAVSVTEAGVDGTAGMVPSSETPPAENEASASTVTAEDLKPESVGDAAAVGDAGTQAVELLVRGLRPEAARVQVAVFEGAQGFPDAAAASECVTAPAGGEETELVVQLKTGAVVAIAVYQDLDGNGVLTKNGLGIPTEPYGFSNNARGTFGPPKFDKAQFTVTDDLKTLEIRVR